MLDDNGGGEGRAELKSMDANPLPVSTRSCKKRGDWPLDHPEANALGQSLTEASVVASRTVCKAIPDTCHYHSPCRSTSDSMGNSPGTDTRDHRDMLPPPVAHCFPSSPAVLHSQIVSECSLCQPQLGCPISPIYLLQRQSPHHTPPVCSLTVTLKSRCPDAELTSACRTPEAACGISSFTGRPVPPWSRRLP